MIQIHHARTGELEAAQALWTEAFGDGGTFQREFYRLCAPDGPLVLVEDGALRSMLALPRMPLILADGRTLRAGYVYALATRAECRGQGWAATLIETAAGLAWNRGLDCLITVPDPPGLFGFYAKYGFRPGFYYKEASAAPQPAPMAPVRPMDYAALRAGLLAGRAYTACTSGQLAFQQAMCPEPGSGLYRLELAHGPGCAAVEGWRSGPVVKELLCAPQDVEQGAAACAALCGAAATARIPAGAADGTPFAAIRWRPGTPAAVREGAGEGWLGLAFD